MKFQIGILLTILVSSGLEIVGQTINTDTLSVTFFNRSKEYNHSDVQDAHMDSDGYIWLGLWKQGLLRINGNRYRYYSKDDGGRSSFSISCIYEDSQQQLWIGDGHGFQKFDKETGQFTDCAKSSFFGHGNYSTQLVAMHEVDDTFMILGTLAGLHLYDKSRDTIVKFHMTGEYKADGASTNWNIKKFCQSEDPSKVWFTSRSGLGQIDLTDYSVTRVESPFDEDMGHVWLMKDIVSIGGKLYIKYKHTKIISYDPMTGKWKLLFKRKLNKFLSNASPKDSFPIYLNNFQKIDERYFMTSSREYGAMIFDTSIDDFTPVCIADEEFSQIDKFENSEWNHHRYFRDPYWAFLDQNGYFWGSYGREMVIKTNQPLVHTDSPISFGDIQLEDVYINGKPVDDSNYISTMTFDVDQRNISFSFCLANPSTPEKLSYRYKLSDSKTWQKPLDGVARFDDMSGGNHTLELQALDGDKVVSDRTLSFSIEKKWYEVWYWLCIIFLLVAIPANFIIKYFIKKKNETLNLKAKMAELEMSALRAQMNPHFLFNSLNSINQYVMTESPQKASAYLTKFSKLMRSILNNSKRKQVSLTEEINALNLYVEMEQLRFDNSFDFEVLIVNGLDQNTIFIPPMIIQPYIENAILHGIALLENRRGLIKLKVETTSESTISISIIDNGIGRAASERIQKGKRIKKESLGMTITSDRIKLATKIPNNYGQVMIQDDYDQESTSIGTTVLIKLPLITNEDIDE